MNPMNFQEWLNHKQKLIELDLGQNAKFSSGKDTASSELTGIANNFVSKNPDIFDKVTDAPSKSKAGVKIMRSVGGAAQKLMSPSLRKKFPVADVAKAVGKSLGTPEILGKK